MNDTSVNLTFLGHGCFHISTQCDGRPVGVILNPEPGVEPGALPLDYILLTHYTLGIWEQAKALAEASKATIVAVNAFSNWIRSLEPDLQTIPLTHDGEVELCWGSAVLTASSYEYRLPNGTTQPGNGFVLKVCGNQIFYSGPAKYDAELRTIGAIYFPNVSILTAGPEHLNPEQMTRSVMWLGSDLLFPVFAGLPEGEEGETFQEEVFMAIDTYTPAICRILEPGGVYPLMPIESTGRQAGPESRY